MNRLLFGLAATVATMAAVDGRTDSISVAEGVVAELKLMDASELGAGSILILSLEDGRVFQVPGQSFLAASPGIQLGLSYLPADEAGEIPALCSATVLAIPVTIDGEQRLQAAQRPFSIYRNAAKACGE